MSDDSDNNTPRRPVGRPSIYSAELANEFCARISGVRTGKPRSVVAVCREDEDMPSGDTIFRWLANNKEFSELYTKAKEIQAELHADECREISDDNSRDFQVDEAYDADGNVIARKIKSDNTAVNRDNLRVNTRKWLMARFATKKYGDKLQQEISGPEGGPVPVVNILLKDPPKPDPEK